MSGILKHSPTITVARVLTSRKEEGIVRYGETGIDADDFNLFNDEVS